MKRTIFKRKKSVDVINEYKELKIEDLELGNLFGGFREYIPPIYDEKQSRIRVENQKELLSNNLNTINNETAKEI